MKRILIALILICFLSDSIEAQIANENLGFFQAADSIYNKQRVAAASTFAGITYTGFSIGLYNTWYKQFELGGFRFFNDWGEWSNVDKMGHIYSAYFQADLVYRGAKWAGLKEDERIIWGVALGSLFQTTIEVMDGFSEEWGFSVYDFGANAIGVGAFALQQKFWHEQRISFKVSSNPVNYPDINLISDSGTNSIPLSTRVNDLYGNGFAQQFLKDYNAQTIWASVNIHSFLKDKSSKFPKWLNIAAGYGAENMFGGFENRFSYENQNYQVDADLYPRYQQFYLSFDIDLNRIKTKSPFLRTLFSVLNIFKIPLPGLEYNSLGEVKWHWLAY